MTKHITPHQDADTQSNQSKKEESKEDLLTIEQHNPSVVLSKQKIVLNKDAGIKTKSRLTVIQGSSSITDHDSEQVENRKEVTTD